MPLLMSAVGAPLNEILPLEAVLVRRGLSPRERAASDFWEALWVPLLGRVDGSTFGVEAARWERRDGK